MSYAKNDMVTGEILLIRREIEQLRTDPFWKLGRMSQDDCFDDYNREKRLRQVSEKRADFVHSMSYNRAIGYISRTKTKQLYNGSTFNRKKTKKIIPEILTDSEQIEQDYRAYMPNRGFQLYQFKVTGSRLTTIKEVPEKIQKEKDLHGTSKRTKDKIKEKMLALYRASSGKKGYRSAIVNFTLCTLTFVEPVADRKGVECLNKFLTALPLIMLL